MDQRVPPAFVSLRVPTRISAGRTIFTLAVLFAAVAVAVTAAVLLAAPSRAATFEVTNTNDAGAGSLRQAILSANANSDADNIDVNATGTINLQSELPRLTTAMQISGPGADDLTVRRDAGGDYRIFTVPGNQGNCCGNTGGPAVTIKGLTVTNGKAPDGGGISNGDVNALTRSALTLDDVAVVENETTNGRGGGVFSVISQLTITDSLISSNTGPNGTNGVGINITSSTGGTISNTTISGNSAPDAFGGGIYLGDGQVPIVNSTIANNGAGQFGSNVWLSTTFGQFYNTIVANPTGNNNCGSSTTPPTYSTSSNNIEFPGTSCAFATRGIGRTVDPDLGALADNGGTTATHAIPATSPAIDASRASSPTTSSDQRGAPVFDGDGNGPAVRDVGAYEFVPRPSLALPQNASVQPDSRAGSTHAYTATATDYASQPITPVCAPASGSVFPAGETTSVQCTATDAIGQRTSGSFTVAVAKVDTTLTLSGLAQTIPFGDSTSVSGRLTDEFGAGLANADVVLESRPASGGAFSPVATLTTSQDGSFSRTVNPDANTVYRAAYAGSSTMSPQQSPETTVDVTVDVSLDLSKSRVDAGRRVAISGSVAPSQQGDVYLTIRRGGKTLRNGVPLTLSNSSTYEYVYRPKSAGDYTVIVFSPGDADHQPGSTTRTLRVKKGR